MVNLHPTIYVGTFVHCRDERELEIIDSGVIGVDQHGKIAFVERVVGEGAAADRGRRDTGPRDVASIAKEHGWDDAPIVSASTSRTQFFFPGFIDTHIHASQYPNAGVFGESTLLDWLNTYTFPLESSLRDLTKARTVYRRCVSRTLAHGTTTAAYYATADVGSTNLLADICHAAGQRAFVGRCCMDALSPDYYKDASTEAAMDATMATIAHMTQLDPSRDLVCPILTPRFAPSCTPATLTALGDLAHRHDLPIQTHMSENLPECQLVRDLFPGYASYTAVYDHHRLLTPRTVLAHVVHVDDAERELIARRGTGVSHCPVSNSALGSGIARVRALLDAGIKVGLGTDVSGGYSPSILEAARQAALVSRLLPAVSSQVSASVGAVQGRAKTPDDNRAKLSIDEVLYLATHGGARLLGLERRVGAFKVGMEWDAQLVELGGVVSALETNAEGEEETSWMHNPISIFGNETWPDRIAKWFYSGDDRNTLRVWVRGKLVHQR